MTATVDFLTGAATDVLTVPNAALRFRATEAMMTTVRPAQGAPARSASAASSDSTRAQRAAAGQRENGPSDARRRNVAMLWYLDESGVLAAARVRTGMTDGQKTEIQGRDLTEGMQVIVGVSAESDAAGSSATSPFQTQQQSGPPRPGGF